MHTDGSITYRTEIVQLPPHTVAWVIDDAGGTRGPIPAIALATRVCDVSLKVLASEGKAPSLSSALGEHEEHEVNSILGVGLELGERRVLLLWPEFGTTDNPWCEARYVFFSKEHARDTAAQRKQVSNFIASSA